MIILIAVIYLLSLFFRKNSEDFILAIAFAIIIGYFFNDKKEKKK